MLASKELIDTLNRQIGNEMGASLLYVSIASYFDSEALPELAQFFFRQAEEERDHSMKFVRFILDVDGKVSIPEIPAQKSNFASAEEAVAVSLQSEEAVTQQIYRLMDVAKNDSNYIATNFLDWFVNEQLEEVNTMSSLLQVVRRAGEGGLLHVEEYLRRGTLGGGGAEEQT